MNNLSFAFRQLRKSPGFTVVAVLTLAVGIGANTVIFSAINTLFLRPLPLAEPERIVRVFSGFPDRGLERAAMSWPRFEEIARQQDVFTDFGAAGFTAFTLTGRGDAEQVNAQRVSGRWFPALGVQPVMGRIFSVEEDRSGGAAAVLVSHRYWQQRFGSDRNLIGQTLILDGVPHTVIGILPASFTVPFVLPDLWVPHADEMEGLSRDLRDRGSGYLQLVARLKPGVTVAQATEALRVIARRYAATVPDKVDAKADIRVISLQEELVGDQRGMFGLLFAAVMCVLLIGCANVANLLLARFSSRRREIAVRSALGATRWRIVGQFVAEGLLLAVAAGVLGVLISVWGLELIRQAGANFIPRCPEIALDGRVLAFSLAVSLGTGITLGLVPGWQVARNDIAELLKDATRGAVGTGRHGRFRAVLLIGEVGLSLVLLVGAGLLLLSFVQVLKIDPGLQADGLTVANLALPPVRYAEPLKQTQFQEQVRDRLQTIPGVTAVSATSSTPFSGDYSRSPVAAEASSSVNINERPLALRSNVLPGYFATLGIPLKRGRDFEPSDRADHPNVVIINQTLARKLFGDRDPLGQRLLTGLQSISREIVGVVGDTRSENLTGPQLDEMYYPSAQMTEPFMSFLMRTPRSSKALHAEIRRMVAAVDAGIPVPEPRLLSEIMTQTFADRRLTMLLLGGFALVALIMAMCGIYSVMAYSVSQRTAEIGVRMALGARPRDVQTLVVRQGMTLAGAGMGLGIAVSSSLTHVMAALLFGIGPRDPLAFASVSVLLAGVSLVACWLPARRAARVDPMVALRAE